MKLPFAVALVRYLSSSLLSCQLRTDVRAFLLRRDDNNYHPNAWQKMLYITTSLLTSSSV